MRLYRMELYKLCHKKAFLLGSMMTVFILVFYFGLMVSDQMSTVDGVTYYGYDAVKIDRQITEAYRGGLTDEKVQRIVKEYGLPSKVGENYGWWRDANYLNGFVARYLSNGYLRDWRNDDYEIPTEVYAIADTTLGELQEAIGKQIPFAYTVGWQIFFETLQIAMFPASILVILIISIVFAQEGQTGMLPLLFTTQEGKETDAKAKVAAAFTLTIIVYGVVVLLDLVLCSFVFGLDGADCPWDTAMWEYIFRPGRIDEKMPVLSFWWIIIGFDLLAMLLLCAITLCVSAYCHSTFGAVSVAAALWGLPLLIRILFGGLGYFITSCMPIFLIMTDSVYESLSWGLAIPTVYVGLALLIMCVVEGYLVYKKQS